MRCIAHLAADPGLIEAFTGGSDIHNATASRVFEVEPDAVTLGRAPRRRWCRTGSPTGWRRTGSVSA
ncbi:MAG: DNA polymerase [Ilumatobacteraceae bacterium]